MENDKGKGEGNGKGKGEGGETGKGNVKATKYVSGNQENVITSRLGSPSFWHMVRRTTSNLRVSMDAKEAIRLATGRIHVTQNEAQLLQR